MIIEFSSRGDPLVCKHPEGRETTLLKDIYPHNAYGAHQHFLIELY